MKKKLQLIILLFLSLAIPALAQKPTYTFTFKVYINEATAQYYGGHAAIENLIQGQFAQANQFYNAESEFTGTYNFVPSVFSYFSETGNNQNVLNNIAVQPAESSYDYRILYSRTPYGGDHVNIIGDYDNATRSIRFALNAESEWGQTLFGTIPTRILSHELGHARGAFDLYSTNVHPDSNEVFNGVGYEYNVSSVMNNLYDLNARWDVHSIYALNAMTDEVITTQSWTDLFWSLFPDNVTIYVKNIQGNPLPNAKVTIYGVRWLSGDVKNSDATVYYTDAQGKVTFDLTNVTNNPFRANDVVSYFSNLMVVAEAPGDGQYNWINVFDTQNAKLNGQTEYSIDFTLNVSGECTENSWSSSAVYTGGAVVQYNGIKYTAWYWTQGQRPDLNYGPQSSGLPWNQIGTCGTTACTAQIWNSTTAYSGGAEVQVNGIKYTAWYWTQNQDPTLNYGVQSSGQPWNQAGTCNSRIGALSTSSTLGLYPNPANDMVTINLETAYAGEVSIVISDMMSKQVLEKETTIASGQNELGLDLSSLSTGMYTISISNGNDKIVKQLVINK